MVVALFQIADNGWIGGICHAEPGLPKLLILSLERIGVMDPPEFLYREYDSKGTLWCDLMIFIGRAVLGDEPGFGSGFLGSQRGRGKGRGFSAK